MNKNLLCSCFRTIMDSSQDIYIVVEKGTLRLLEYNHAFSMLYPDKHLNGEEVFLDQKPYNFSDLKDIIATQTSLLNAGNSPNDIDRLLLLSHDNHRCTQGELFAKTVHILEENNAVLVQLSQDTGTTFSFDEDLHTMKRQSDLLKAASIVAQELLSESQDFDATINNVLGILGNATQVDRVYVWSIHEAPNPEEDHRLFTSQLYEWSEGAEPQQDKELVHNLPVEESIIGWMEFFLAGKCVNNLVKNMSTMEQEILVPQGIVSILTAPIMFHGHLWGFIGFDNCHSEYTWSRTEEDILRTTGTLISTAIHSRRTSQALCQAQERFRGVEEATGDIIWSVDAQQNINYISPHIKTVLYYEPEEIIGKHFSVLFLHPDEFVCTATPENYIMRDFELRVRCKDGSIKWLRSSCKYTFNDHGQMLYGFGSSSDVTRVREVQDALQIANKELEEAIKIANELVESANKANAIKSNFIANVSHEIRTPMNAIVGITRLLKHTDLNQKQKDYIATIDDASGNLLNIINDILDFSKIQDGNMSIKKHAFSIQNIVNEVTRTAAEWTHEKNLKFYFHIDPQVAPRYIGDAVRLHQILTSLTTNAIKFTHEGSVTVNLHIDSENNESALLHFSVQDTGIGIPKEHIKALFEGFTQADISSTRRYGGIGLGLALSRNLTILMGGDIWCTSTLGEGSTFHFTCRLEKEVARKAPPPKPLKEILIVAALPDDDSFIQLKSTLSPLGYSHVHFAPSILRIRQLMASKNSPDVIITHADFGEFAILDSILKTNHTYFDDIPVILIAPDSPQDIVSVYTIIDSMAPSVLHDAFVDVLGAKFTPDLELCQHGFEHLLRERHKGKKVLLVEDNEVNQMIAQTILEDVGLVVTIANNGLEGCQLIQQEEFDLVIMDIQMPKMDGLSAAKKIRENSDFAHIPIVAMTAHAMEEDREKSLNAGMNDHTTKPIDTVNLFKVLLYWLSKNNT